MHLSHQHSTHGSATKRVFASLLFLTLMITSCTGCSLFVMAGKAVFGDPKVASQLKLATGKDLSDGEDALLIICSAPHRLLTNFQSLQIDIVDRVSRNLESRNVKVIPSGDVATWYDDHGEWGDYSELAAEFGARYVLHIELREFDYRVPESENLMQGNAEGRILVHEVQEDGKQTKVMEQIPVSLVFDRNFTLTFPTSYPVPREKRSEDMFLQGFLDRLAQHLSQHLYDYRMSESIH